MTLVSTGAAILNQNLVQCWYVGYEGQVNFLVRLLLVLILFFSCFSLFFYFLLSCSIVECEDSPLSSPEDRPVGCGLVDVVLLEKGTLSKCFVILV